MVDVGALRSLIAVRDHGSIVAAARALGFTPSAVSQQIKRLQGTGRRPLLERIGRGVVLTEHAHRLVEHAAELLEALDALEQLVHSGEETVAGPYCLATFATANRGLVAPLLARLEVCAPQLRVNVVEHDPWDVVATVAAGQADLGVVHNWNTIPLELPTGLDVADVLTDRADVLVRRDHPLAGQGPVSPPELAGQRWVSTPAGTICHAWLVQMHATHRLRPDLRYGAGDFATHVAMVSAGVAIALVPRLGRGPLPPDVTVLEIEDPVPQRGVQLIWRRSARTSATRALVERELTVAAGAVARAGGPPWAVLPGPTGWGRPR